MKSIGARNQRVCVLGAGVIGLTCAERLAPNYNVSIVADKFGAESDSQKATAIWHVYLVPETELVLRWARETLEHLIDLEGTAPSSGISLVEGTELFRGGIPHIPIWAHIPPQFSLLSSEEVELFNRLNEDDYRLHPLLVTTPVVWGYKLKAPAADMSIYLPWLESINKSAGVKMIRKEINSIDELYDEYDVIVNCSGYGAKRIFSDNGFVPYKGQYYVFRRDEASPATYIGDDDHPYGMAYVIPRGDEVLVGGCAVKGVEDLIPMLDFDEVRERAGLYSPWLRSRKLEDQSRPTVVGIRPARADGVRLELDRAVKQRSVIHNYGHGGSGFSLAWGCAGDVKSIIDKLN